MVSGSKTNPESGIERDRDDRYATVRAASVDAILDAIGTVLLLGFALLFLAISVRALLIDAWSPIAVGFLVAAVAVAGAAFNLVPPFRE